MLIYLSMISSEEDKTKFEIIYTAYKKLMFYTANQILGDTRDSEDIVHQAFLKIVEIIDQIEQAKCPKTKNLVVTITERKAIDLYRVRKRRTVLSLDDENINVPAASVLDDIPGCSPLAKAMVALPTKYRELLLLKYDSGYSDHEIAGLLSMTDANVKKTIQRAKAKLGTMLAEMEGEYR